MLKDRMVSALVLICVLLCVLLSDSAVLYIAVCAVGALSALELYRAFLKNGEKKPFGLLLFLSFGLLLLPISLFIHVALDGNDNYILMVLYTYVVLLFLSVILNNDKVSAKSVLSVGAMNLLVTCCLLLVVLTRQYTQYGNLLIWIIFVGACMTDTFAYFTGLLIGRHKLTPVSPKKTVEGAVGGLLGACVSMAVFGFVCACVTDATPNYLHLTILGAITGIFAQIGDLSFSAVKRELGVKDYGNLFPGHGGILDRIDSILFVAPVVYFYVTHFTIFM